VEYFDVNGNKETYKYENTSFNNGQDDFFFKPLIFSMILDEYTLEENIFLERPSNNILDIPVRYQKYKLITLTGLYDLIEKSYAEYTQGIDVKRYSYSGSDSTIIFDGTLIINNHQKIESYLYTDNLGGNYSGSYEYNDKNYVVKENLKVLHNNTESTITYAYVPDGEEGISQFEYRIRNEKGEGETEILQFSYADPLNTNFDKAISFEVFPNPALDVINFEIKSLQNKSEILIIDSNGKTILQKNLRLVDGKVQLSTAALSSGTYMVFLVTGSDIYKSSFVKVE